MVSKIEKDIPIPSRSGQGRKYPWNEMNEIKDSFWEPCDEGESTRKCMLRMNSASCNNARKTGRKYTKRIVEEGVRVWRIK